MLSFVARLQSRDVILGMLASSSWSRQSIWLQSNPAFCLRSRFDGGHQRTQDFSGLLENDCEYIQKSFKAAGASSNDLSGEKRETADSESYGRGR
jgi:hypothetical protein